MSFIKDFKEFAVRGNVMDMAVGVIIGGAFGKIVSSAISDLIMPVVGMFGERDFSNYYVPLTESIQRGADGILPALSEAKNQGAVLAYGNFATVVVDFLILAVCVFVMVKFINSLKRKEEAKPSTPPKPSREEVLLAEIRDALKSRA